MKYILIILLSLGTAFAQEYRQIYGSSGSVAGVQTSENLRSIGLAGQPITGTASGGNFGAGGGFAQLRLSVELVLNAPDGPLPLPEEFAFPQNYPNPFNPSTSFEFALPTDARTRLVIFDMLGREVAVLIDKQLPPGRYIQHFQSPGNLASGLYFAVFTADEYHQVRKLMLIK